ncbi:MAG: hypothetical protein Q4Q07_10010, partial [Tissierellia bacterium]|nr:hypothetical protein [Tissierellia bacterium]
YPTRYVAATDALKDFVVGDKVTFLADPASKYADYDAPFAYEIKNETLDARKAAAAAVEEKINALADPVTTKEEREAARKVKADYDALDDDVKKHVAPEAVTKLNKALAEADIQDLHDAQKVRKVSGTTIKDVKKAVIKLYNDIDPTVEVTVNSAKDDGATAANPENLEVVFTKGEAEYSFTADFTIE